MTADRANAQTDQTPTVPDERAAFEDVVKNSPYERSIARWPDDHTIYAWPGSYEDLAVDLAWQCWRARAAAPARLAQVVEAPRELTDEEAGSLCYRGSSVQHIKAKATALGDAVMKVWFVLKKHGKHPGRTDDTVWDAVDAALAAQPAAAPAVPAGWRECLEQLVACHDEPTCPAVSWANELLAAAPAQAEPAHPSAEPVAASGVHPNAVCVAQDVALEHAADHSYLPGTREEALRWKPHTWVLDAMYRYKHLAAAYKADSLPTPVRQAVALTHAAIKAEFERRFAADSVLLDRLAWFEWGVRWAEEHHGLTAPKE